MKADFYSNVTDGRLQPGVAKMIAGTLKTHEGKRVHITIERHHAKRTLPQNALFHMYVGIIAKDLGYDFDEMKEIVKFKFLLKEKTNESTGEVMKYIAPTSGLSKMDFIELIDKMVRWTSETFGIILPSPSQYGVD